MLTLSYIAPFFLFISCVAWKFAEDNIPLSYSPHELLTLNYNIYIRNYGYSMFKFLIVATCGHYHNKGGLPASCSLLKKNLKLCIKLQMVIKFFWRNKVCFIKQSLHVSVLNFWLISRYAIAYWHNDYLIDIHQLPKLKVKMIRLICRHTIFLCFCIKEVLMYPKRELLLRHFILPIFRQ